MQCVAVASRPLRVEELAQILAFDFITGPIPKYHEGWVLNDPIYAVLSTTKSLLTIVSVDGSQVITFSHFSVKEFLTSPRLAAAEKTILRRYHISMTPAHTLSAQVCLGMLLHLDENITRDKLKDFPLVKYAAKHWVDHARFEGVSSEVDDGMKLLFDPKTFHFATWVWIYDSEDQYWHREKRSERPSQPRGTPLHYAALCGLDSIVKFLVIEHSQDVHARGFDLNSTPLHLACRSGQVGVACFLLDNGADAEARDNRKSTPLHLASTWGHADVVRVLLDRPVDPTPKDFAQQTPTFLAYFRGHQDVLAVFIDFHVGEFWEDQKNWSQLDWALFYGDIKGARVLLDRGTDPNRQGNALFDAALRGGYVEAVRVLLEHGVDPIIRDSSGMTPLHYACIRGHVDMVRIFLEHGVVAAIQDKDVWTPLHAASGGGHLEVIRLLLNQGADVTVQDNQGQTALHLASVGGHASSVGLLLEHRSDVIATPTKYGMTPLHCAAAAGHINVASVLLKNGADASARNNVG
jgi:ankyrin repeat protein